MSTHLYSPSLLFDESPEDEMYWLQYADFVDFPHIQYFDSYEHLVQIIPRANLKQIHEAMMEELQFRERKVSKSWCDISARIKNQG